MKNGFHHNEDDKNPSSPSDSVRLRIEEFLRQPVSTQNEAFAHQQFNATFSSSPKLTISDEVKIALKGELPPTIRQGMKTLERGNPLEHADKAAFLHGMVGTWFLFGKLGAILSYRLTVIQTENHEELTPEDQELIPKWLELADNMQVTQVKFANFMNAVETIKNPNASFAEAEKAKSLLLQSSKILKNLEVETLQAKQILLKLSSGEKWVQDWRQQLDAVAGLLKEFEAGIEPVVSALQGRGPGDKKK